MTNKINIQELTWKGPFAWPNFEDENGLKKLPNICGLYLQTFEYEDGYLIYAAGLTRRSAPKRFAEHAKHYLNGDYNVLDMSSITKGVRKLIWRGWTYSKKHRKEFSAKKARIINAVNRQLLGFRIFIAEVDKKHRVLERLEASIMNNLYNQLPPISSIPDQGMQLAPKWDTERPIIVKNNCDHLLYGLPNYLEI